MPSNWCVAWLGSFETVLNFALLVTLKMVSSRLVENDLWNINQVIGISWYRDITSGKLHYNGTAQNYTAVG